MSGVNASFRGNVRGRGYNLYCIKVLMYMESPQKTQTQPNVCVCVCLLYLQNTRKVFDVLLAISLTKRG